MEVTCSCGKKLYFGSSDEEQICDRCGQTVKASGAPAAKLPPARGAARGARGGARRGRRHGATEELAAQAVRRPRAPPLSSRGRLTIAGERKSRRGVGCLALIVVAAGGVFGADYYMNPPRRLPCGHEGKLSYAFGALPFGHGCEGLRAVLYLDRARLATQEASGDYSNFRILIRTSDLGHPPEGTPYEFSLLSDGSLAADPKAESSDLYHYLMEPDGTVRYERGAEATGESPLARGPVD
jgi:hypothetical protein